MGEISSRIDKAFRDHVTVGIPASGAHEPIKAEIRAIGPVIEANIAAAALSGTDLNAAMALVAPLLSTAQAAKVAADQAAASAQNSYTQVQYVATTLPSIVDTRLDAAVADATAQAGGYAAQASTARDAAQLAASSAAADSRYYPTRAAGEAATTTGQLFSTKDGSNNLVFYERTAGGSTLVTPGAFAPKAGPQFTGPAGFATNGSRVGITNGASPITPQALLEIVNNGVNTNGLRVSSRWTGTTALPYQNNDNSLWETFNRVESDSANFSWSVSAPNAYNDIPAGVHDSGERVGVYGWATSVNIPGQYEHAGWLTSQIGVRGRAGFQGDSNQSPSTARISKAVGVKGEVRNDSALATINLSIAGEFTNKDPGGIVENNIGVYSEVTLGTEANWSFFGAAGELFNEDRAFFGEGTVSARQSDCLITARGVRPNALEFGHPDPSGYGSNLGRTAGSGYPFLAFCGEAEASGNTYRTRGKLGSVIYGDLAGALVFARLTNANNTGQTPNEIARFSAAGNLILQMPIILKSGTPASSSAPGIAGEVRWDGSYIYLCTATDTWKRVPLESW